MYMSFNCLYSITTDPRVLAVGLEIKIKVLYCFSLTQVSVILYNFYYCNVIAWPTFYDPMILPYILNTVRWIGIILGIIVQYVIKIYHILPGGQPDLYLSPPIKGEVAILFLVRILCYHQHSFLYARYLMNRLRDFYQICMDLTLGHVEQLIRFWRPWPNFQGHCGT